MASCLLVVGYLFLVIGFLGSGVGFFAPFWKEDYAKIDPLKILNVFKTDVGLWGQCRNMQGTESVQDVGDALKQLEDKCVWFYQNDFQWEQNQTWWHKTAQALFALGFVSVFAVLLIASVHLCCCCRDSLSVVKIVGAILILAALMMFGSLGLFGGFSWKEYNTSVNSGLSKFNWGFYTGIGGGGLCFLAGIVYLIETCRYRSHEGYTRGDAVV